MSVIAKKRVHKRRFWYITIGLLSSILLTFLLVNQWIRTYGNDWVEQQLRTTLQKSGYDINVTDLHISSTGTLTAHSIRLFDADGPFLRIQKPVLLISFRTLLTRSAFITLNLDKLTLERLPLSKTNPPSEPPVLPDLSIPWIRTLGLTLNIASTSINSAVLPMGYQGPLNAELRLSSPGEDSQIMLQVHSAGSSLSIPEELELQATLNADKQEISKVVLSLNHPDYTADLEGSSILSSLQSQLSGSIKYLDTSKHVPWLSGPATATLSIQGILPAALHGNISLETSLDQTPLTITSNLTPAEIPDALEVSMNADFGTASLTGTATVLTGDIGVNGTLHYHDSGLLVPRVFLPDSALHGTADLTLTPRFDSGVQNLKVHGSISDVSYLDHTLTSLSVDARIQDLLKALSYRGSLQMKNLGTAGVQIDSIETNISGDRKQLRSEVRIPTLPEYPGHAQGNIVVEFSPLNIQIPSLMLTSGTGSLAVQGSLAEDQYSVSVKPQQFQLGLIPVLHTSPEILIDSGTIALTGTLSPDSFPHVEIKNLTVSQGEGRIAVNGSVSDTVLDLNARINKLSLASLPYLDFLKKGIVDDARLTLAGTAQKPTFDLKLKAHDLYELPFKVALESQYSTGKLNAIASVSGDGIETLDATLSMPASVSLYPLRYTAPSSTPLSGKLSGSLNLDTSSAPYLGAGRTLRGVAELEGDLSGSFAEPQYTASIVVDKGSTQSELFDLSSFQLQSTFTQERATLKLTARDTQKGTLSLDAQAMMEDLLKTLRVDLLCDAFTLGLLEYGIAQITSDLHVSIDDGAPLVEGTITPDHVEVIIPSRRQGSIPSLHVVKAKKSSESSFLDTIKLDVLVSALQEVFVRGLGADLELSGKLTIAGTATRPSIKGVLSLVRGRFQQFGKRFTLDKAEIHFNGSVPPDPTIDLLAQTDTTEATAQILILGPLEDPSLKLSSIPELPNDEIISRILFDKGLSDISPLQAVQIAQTLDRLSGKGRLDGFDPLGTIREATGVDDIHVESDGKKDVTVGAGKYITDSVFLEIEKGSSAESAAAKVDVEISPEVTLESKTNETGNTGATLYWEWSY